jgi:hypothetical protein
LDSATVGVTFHQQAEGCCEPTTAMSRCTNKEKQLVGHPQVLLLNCSTTNPMVAAAHHAAKQPATWPTNEVQQQQQQPHCEIKPTCWAVSSFLAAAAACASSACVCAPPAAPTAPFEPCPLPTEPCIPWCCCCCCRPDPSPLGPADKSHAASRRCSSCTLGSRHPKPSKLVLPWAAACADKHCLCSAARRG